MRSVSQMVSFIASAEQNCKIKIYHGIAETSFKLRYEKHRDSFNHRKHECDTELSNEYWKMNY